MRATRQTGRPAAVALGVLLTLAVLACVSDAVDPEAFSPAPAPPTVWIGLQARSIPSAGREPERTPPGQPRRRRRRGRPGSGGLRAPLRPVDRSASSRAWLSRASTARRRR